MSRLRQATWYHEQTVTLYVAATTMNDCNHISYHEGVMRWIKIKNKDMGGRGHLLLRYGALQRMGGWGACNKHMRKGSFIV